MYFWNNFGWFDITKHHLTIHVHIHECFCLHKQIDSMLLGQGRISFKKRRLWLCVCVCLMAEWNENGYNFIPYRRRFCAIAWFRIFRRFKVHFLEISSSIKDFLANDLPLPCCVWLKFKIIIIILCINATKTHFHICARNFIHVCCSFCCIRKNEENNLFVDGFFFPFKKLMMQNTTFSNYILWKGYWNTFLVQRSHKKKKRGIKSREKKGWKLCHKNSHQKVHFVTTQDTLQKCMKWTGKRCCTMYAT